jgi:antitoxin VapB
MVTAQLFKLGNSQAVRIPARFRIQARAVEVFERDGELILRPVVRTAADLFERVRSMAGVHPGVWRLPKRRAMKQVQSLD